MDAQVTSLAVEQPAAADASAAEDLLRLFLLDKAELTARNYSVDFRCFARFLSLETSAEALAYLFAQRRRDAHALVIQYRQWLKKKAPVYRSPKAEAEGRVYRRGYSAATVNRRLTALRAVTKLARIMELVDWRIEVPFLRVQPLRDTEGCGPHAYHQLLDHVADEIASAVKTENTRREAILRRDLAIIRLLHDSALRRVEVLSIDYPDDLRIDRNSRRVQILGKLRDEKEWHGMSLLARDAVRAWIQIRGKEPGPLFTSTTRPGSRLTVSAVNVLVQRHAESAGISVTPHGLRHTAGTQAMVKTNGNVADVAKFLRHKDVKLTQIYDDRRTNPSAKIGDLVSEPPADYKRKKRRRKRNKKRKKGKRS